MAVDDTGDWGQPNFLASGAPEIDVDPSAVADYFAALARRRFTTQANLIAAGAPPADGYSAAVDAIPGAVFLRQSGAWVMHGIPRFATTSTRNAAITTPATGMLSRVDTERFVRRYDGTTWKPWGAGLFPIIPTSVAGTGIAVGADGLLTFTAATGTVSINGCFPTEFDDFTFKLGGAQSAVQTVSVRLRAAGADDAGSNYIRQTLTGSASAAAAAATGFVTSGTLINPMSNAARVRARAEFSSPSLAESSDVLTHTTAYDLTTGAMLVSESELGHGLATPYDGFSLIFSAGTFTGKGRMFAYNNN